MVLKKFVCLLVVLSTLTVYCQHRPVIISATENDGLSDNRVNCFYKDMQGFVWIGTANGLNRYDGIQFKIYQPVVTEPANSLPNGFITAISGDNSGNLWVATHKGISKINNRRGSIENFLPSWKGKADGLPGDLVWDIYPESDTSIWAAVNSRALVRFNPITRQYYLFDFKKQLLDQQISYTKNYHSIFKILPKNEQELWLATTEGIFVFDKKKGQFNLLHGMQMDNIRLFYAEPSTKKIYCIDEHEKIYIINTATGRLESVVENDTGDKKSPMPYTFPGSLVCIPGKNELAFLNAAGKIETRLQVNDPSATEAAITTTYRDHDNIWWIGTNKGIKRIVPGLNNLLHLQFAKNLESATQYPAKNFMYNATQQSWLLVSWRENKIWNIDNYSGRQTILDKPRQFNKDTCTALYSNHPDTMYFLGKGCVLEYLPKTKQWKKIAFPPPWNNSTITAMVKDKRGNCWIGTFSKGLFGYNAASNQAWSPGTGAYLPAHIIASLYYDDVRDIVWAGTFSSGLYQYHTGKNIFQQVKRNDIKPGAMHSSLINDIQPAGDGNLWVATWEGGLALVKPGADSSTVLSHIDMQNGLPENTVYGVAATKDQRLFLSTGKGIVYAGKDGTIKALYNAGAGLPFSKFIQGIQCDGNNRVATISDNNFICFDAGAIIAPATPVVAITEVMLHDTTNILDGNAILSYKNNDLVFSFVLPEFAGPAAVTYFYMLQGNDKDWLNNKQLRTARYSNLAPGHYTFLVKARRPDGSFSEAAAWHFTIQPPFWQRWWFKLLCALLVIGLLFKWQKSREKRLQKKSAEQAAVQQQMAALEIKALRSQMNPHFIFNSLNSISMLMAGGQKEKGLLYIQKFSRLLRMVLNESENNINTLSEEINMLELYLQLEQLRFGDSFIYKIETQISDPAEDIMLPAFIVQPVVENAVWHGLLHKEGNRKLLIRFSQQEAGSIECVVEDNGIGMEAAAKFKQSKLSNAYPSKGLQMVKDRLRLIWADHRKEMFFKIENIAEGNEATSGTRVIIKIPLTGET